MMHSLTVAAQKELSKSSGLSAGKMSRACQQAVLCRAAENNCYFASVNVASAGSPTTSAVVRPDGTLLCYQLYGKEGLLIADIDLTEATGLLAARCKYPENLDAPAS